MWLKLSVCLCHTFNEFKCSQQHGFAESIVVTVEDTGPVSPDAEMSQGGGPTEHPCGPGHVSSGLSWIP